MTIQFSEIGLEEQLGSFKVSLESIDMESVKKRTAKAFAEEMAEQVRLAVVAEDDISSPARLQSQYEHGPGPSMARRAAWNVSKSGANSYTVTPHPSVRKRAEVLNYGVSGKIYPKDADALRFTIDGVPVYRPYVEGPDQTNYWSAAMRNMEASGEVEKIAEYELRAEIEESF